MKKQKRTFKQNRIFTQNNPLSPRICPELAKEIGLSESVLLLQYEFWIATEGEERDGHLWVRKTVREIKQVFEFWGTSTINRIINNLINGGYVIADALDEGDRKNGRWLRFGFDKLATLSSIKIICAETGQTICADLGGISADLGQPITQNGTNNGTSPYIGIKSKENEESPHTRLMSFHSENLKGPIPDAPTQGAAIKWLLTHYDPVVCLECYESLLRESWRSKVSWLTVKSEIGSWLKRNAPRDVETPKKSQVGLATLMGRGPAYYIRSFEKGLSLSSDYPIEREIAEIGDDTIRAQVNDWYQKRERIA